MRHAEDGGAEAEREEALGEGLGALEPDLEELREPEAERASLAYDDNRTRVAILAKLAILEGPDAGKEVPFAGIRMVLGRAPNLEVTLTDLAVSRRHIEFVRGDNGVLLRDLGSGNGTLVNGRQATEQILAHNDIITVGTSRLRYIDEAKAHIPFEPTSSKEKAQKEGEEQTGEAKQEQALASQELSTQAKGQGSGRGKRRWLIVVSAGVLLCLVGVGFFVYWKQRLLPVVDDSAVVESLMSQAHKAVGEGDYDGALRLVGQITETRPGTDISNFHKQIELEREVDTRLQQVEVLALQKDFEQAKEALGKISEASARLNARRKELSARIAKEQQQFQIQNIEEWLMLGDFDEASKALKLLPKALQAEVGQKIAEGRVSYAEAQQQEKEEELDKRKAGRLRETERRKQQIAVAFANVQRKFGREEWQRAKDECDRVIDAYPKDAEIRRRAKELQRQILEFGQAYEEGVKKYQGGQVAAAAKPLSRAYALYLNMNLSSAAGEALRGMLSQAALLAGEEALARGNFAAATAHCKEANRLQASSERAQRCMQKLAEKAEDLFGTAQTLQVSNSKEALRYFRLVMEMTPVSSPLHEKAKKQVGLMADKALE